MRCTREIVTMSQVSTYLRWISLECSHCLKLINLVNIYRVECMRMCVDLRESWIPVTWHHFCILSVKVFSKLVKSLTFSYAASHIIIEAANLYRQPSVHIIWTQCVATHHKIDILFSLHLRQTINRLERLEICMFCCAMNTGTLRTCQWKSLRFSQAENISVSVRDHYMNLH